MPYKRGVAATIAIPSLLKRQLAQHIVDEPSHLADPPTRPSPQLRYTVIEHGNAMRLRPPRNPPVKARVVDQHDRVRWMMAEVPIRLANKIPKLVNIEQHTKNPHHGQLCEVFMQLTASRRHPRTTISHTFTIRPTPPQLANQIRAMQITTRLTNREKYLHGSNPRTGR